MMQDTPSVSLVYSSLMDGTIYICGIKKNQRSISITIHPCMKSASKCNIQEWSIQVKLSVGEDLAC